MKIANVKNNKYQKFTYQEIKKSQFPYIKYD